MLKTWKKNDATKADFKKKSALKRVQGALNTFRRTSERNRHGRHKPITGIADHVPLGTKSYGNLFHLHANISLFVH